MSSFLKGTELDCLEAEHIPFKISTDSLFDENGLPIDMANRPMMTIKIPFERPIKTGSMLRMKVDD